MIVCDNCCDKYHLHDKEGKYYDIHVESEEFHCEDCEPWLGTFSLLIPVVSIHLLKLFLNFSFSSLWSWFCLVSNFVYTYKVRWGRFNDIWTLPKRCEECTYLKRDQKWQNWNFWTYFYAQSSVWCVQSYAHTVPHVPLVWCM